MMSMRRLQRRILSLASMALLVSITACTTANHGGGQPGPHAKVGNPYKINGRWYHPKVDPTYDRVGVASWYGRDFHRKQTANGEIFDMNLLSAAHTTLPMPSMVEVENLENGRTLVVRVNDRGPFADNRLIDLSREAARQLGFEHQGLARVRVRYLAPAPLHAKAPAKPREAKRYASQKATSPQTTQPVKQDVPAPASSPTIIAAASRLEEPPLGKPQSVAIAVSSPVDLKPATEPDQVNAVAEPAVSPSAQASQAVADKPTAPVQKLYVIRVAALSKLDNVERLKAQMEPIGPLRLSRIETDEARIFYRINMGPYNALPEATARLEQVRSAGYNDASIITITP